MCTTRARPASLVTSKNDIPAPHSSTSSATPPPVSEASKNNPNSSSSCPPSRSNFAHASSRVGALTWPRIPPTSARLATLSSCGNRFRLRRARTSPADALLQRLHDVDHWRLLSAFRRHTHTLPLQL